uniref:Retrovirus-related Pol polyprotein from transposon TNT 1-94 n=1 Tax=Tanacetum cinerariifolium TaxID=118510 RepID=A0A699GR03_TANCI|nr:retrovirus-related Pol polyprotein from transposon TNT 1-94 [Tanacetum cinerariifolium]
MEVTFNSGDSGDAGVVVGGSETEEGLCKELQFSLVDNSKLNVVYLLNRSLKRFVSLLKGLQGGKKIALCQKEKSNLLGKRVMDPKLCYNTFKFKEGESLTQTFTRSKALMNELVNDAIKLLKLEINIGFINKLSKKWLAFCQSLRNTNHVKESELTSLFGKLEYEENLINSIYETNKEKTLVFTTSLSTAFLSTSIVQDFHDSPDDEEDTRSSQEYMNDVEEEYQSRALLSKSKRFFRKADESLVCSTPLFPLEKLAGAKPVSGSKTIKSILKSKSSFKPKTLKGVVVNESSLTSAKGNISTSVSKTNSVPAGKLKNVKMEDDPPLAIVMKELNELKLQISKNKSSYSRNKNSQQVNQHHSGQGESFSRSRIISLRRGIKPKDPQHVTKNCETCGSDVRTTTDHNDIKWFRKREALQAKKAETFKTRLNHQALKPNKPEGPPFTDHMLAICSAAKPVVFKAPKPSTNAKRDSKGTKPKAQPGYKKYSTSSKQPFVSSQEATKDGSSKAPTGSKTSHLKQKKDSSSTVESNPSHTLVFTHVVTEMHKEDQQATGGPTSLGVTSEERASPQLSSDQT